MTQAADGDLDDWLELTTVTAAKEAREIVDLLREARVAVRMARGTFAEDSRDLTVLSGSGYWVVEVLAAELPVAAGVLDHFLEAMRPHPEGDHAADAVLAAIDEDDPALAESLAAERANDPWAASVLVVAVWVAVIGIGIGLAVVVIVVLSR